MTTVTTERKRENLCQLILLWVKGGVQLLNFTTKQRNNYHTNYKKRLRILSFINYHIYEGVVSFEFNGIHNNISMFVSICLV